MFQRLCEVLRHFFNPLHVFCRLRDCKVSLPAAHALSRVWERHVFKRPRLALLVLAAIVCLVSCSGQAHAGHRHKERYYQEIWCAQHGGTLEVRLPSGLRIDCETATHAVEVDFAAKWAEAVGQSLAYAGATHKTPGILLILERPTDVRYLNKLLQMIAIAGLSLDVWTITPEECAQ